MRRYEAVGVAWTKLPEIDRHGKRRVGYAIGGNASAGIARKRDGAT